MADLVHPLDNGGYTIKVSADTIRNINVLSSYQDQNNIWRYEGIITIDDGNNSDSIPISEVPEYYFVNA